MESSAKDNRYVWKLRDVIMVALLSIVFAVVYLGAVYLSSFFSSLLAPVGLAPLGNEIVTGVWFMASTLAAYVLQKPGVATIAEALAALVEMFLGSVYGPMVFVSGIIQGIGAEAAFALTRYKRFDMTTMCLAASGSCVTSFAWEFFRYDFNLLAAWLLIVMFIIRLASSLLLSGVLCKLAGDTLAETGLLKSYALGKPRG
ncbi:MAG: ECF transporter S component [Synergistaceae bacterium]|jgi:energy-coupling factor transport system substrate-specific component|nr:ECF transporter S component [Synergistaceae bacterium]